MKKKRVLNKKVLKNSILQVFRGQPFKKLNYKQVSKALRLKKIGDKILVFEAMNDLRAGGFLTEPKTGSFVLANQKKAEPGTVLFSNKSGVVIELSGGKEVVVDKKDSLFSLKGDLVEVVPLKSKKGSSLSHLSFH